MSIDENRCEAWCKSTDGRCKLTAGVERISQGGIRIRVCFAHHNAWRVYPHWWTRKERMAP